MQQYKFKAWELDPRILEYGPILLKQTPMKPPTQPVVLTWKLIKRQIQ
jgi:targeting protein for Xklp2